MRKLKLEIGQGTAKLLIRIVKRYLLRYGHSLSVDDQRALYNFMEPIVDFVERPPIYIEVEVQVVKDPVKKDEED